MEHENENVCVATGAGVTTKGMSGLYTNFDPTEPKNETIVDAGLLLLDTAGRNAPAKRRENSPVESLLNDIRDARSKERLIDDLILSLADMIIYVLDEVLNEDQRTIMHLVTTIKDKQLLVIMHNWKRQSCGEKDQQELDKLIKEQVEDSFGARRPKSNTPRGKAKHHSWESEWILEGDRPPVTVLHYILLNHNECADHNLKVVRQIETDMERLKSAHKKANTGFLENLVVNANKALEKYVRLEDVEHDQSPDPEKEGPKITLNQNEKVEPTWDALIQWPLPQDKHLVPLTWAMREMPEASYLSSSGSWVPQISQPRPSAGDPVIFRISLPGLNISDRLKTDRKNPISHYGNKTWFDFQTYQENNGDVSWTIRGHRAYPTELPWSLDRGAKNTYGNFRYTFKIGKGYKAPKAKRAPCLELQVVAQPEEVCPSGECDELL